MPQDDPFAPTFIDQDDRERVSGSAYVKVIAVDTTLPQLAPHALAVVVAAGRPDVLGAEAHGGTRTQRGSCLSAAHDGMACDAQLGGCGVRIGKPGQ